MFQSAGINWTTLFSSSSKLLQNPVMSSSRISAHLLVLCTSVSHALRCDSAHPQPPRVRCAEQSSGVEPIVARFSLIARCAVAAAWRVKSWSSTSFFQSRSLPSTAEIRCRDALSQACGAASSSILFLRSGRRSRLMKKETPSRSLGQAASADALAAAAASSCGGATSSARGGAALGAGGTASSAAGAALCGRRETSGSGCALSTLGVGLVPGLLGEAWLSSSPPPPPRPRRSSARGSLERPPSLPGPCGLFLSRRSATSWAISSPRCSSSQSAETSRHRSWQSFSSSSSGSACHVSNALRVSRQSARSMPRSSWRPSST
mmetsp:Transcript_13189/g.41617  ORF Transcript_13189/g.41617 Transcript_13189/m.41617 type:complete len:320 (-) Transcript_13189:1973-2932(-)